MTKEEVVRLAMDAFGWKEAKCISWYKLENKLLGGNSPFELVNRGEADRVIAFLKSKRAERGDEDSKNSGAKDPKERLKRLRFTDES